MLSVCDLAPVPEVPFPLQPANAPAKQAKRSSPIAAYPTQASEWGHLPFTKAKCNASAKSRIASDAVSHIGRAGIRSFGCGCVNRTNCDSAVVTLAVHDAAAEALAACGVQVAAAPKLLVPFLNCTVPVGPAPLLVVEIV